jgi:hypothetical protein
VYRRRIHITSIVLSIVSTGCTQEHCEPAKVLSIFKEFSYVGVAPVTDSDSAGPHTFSVQTLPTSLEPGKHYLFHLRRSVGNSNIWPTLVQRLKGAGLQVTKAPKSAGELGHLVVGGPLFRIEFRCGSQQGLIYNAPETAQQKSTEEGQWGAEDFLLELNR